MKKILITGANSYIGTNFEKYLSKFGDDYKIDTLDMKNKSWVEFDFSKYDVVYHVAGIAHIKETKNNASLYYEVNEKMAVETAKKAKEAGVKQFIILSTMNVYGVVSGKISKKSVPNPKSNYGKSKYNADLKIEKMACDSFKVAIVRPPMVYGKGCKGNYQILRKFALKSPIFPMVKNERSMIYVNNLSFFIKNLIDYNREGLFFPQDEDYINTSTMVLQISQINNKKIKLTRIFNWCIHLFVKLKIGVFTKVFGSLTYEKDDIVKEFDFLQSITETER